jgi:radical SAM superfamily enzyme YgiQ (UPF0313 family)
MTKILFVQNGFYELDGILSINAFVKNKHETRLFIGNPEDLKKELDFFKPDVVGIYVLTKDHYWALNLAKTIKKNFPNTLVLLGGPHATFYQKILLNENIDLLCISEGEKPVLNLLNRLDEKKDYLKIKSLFVKRNGKIYENPLDTPLKIEDIPTPTTEIYDKYSDKIDSSALQIMCSRGCPFNCPFCLNYGLRKMYKSSFFRIRKIESIIKQMQMVMEKKKIKTIVFQDDIFGMDKKWLNKFLKEYKLKINLPFYCLLRCDVINEELINEIKRAGCFEVGIGIESGDEELRNSILNKRLKNSTIITATNILKKKGIDFHTFNMFCLPNETIKEAIKTVLFNIKIKPTVAKSLIFQPYPGTKFFNENVEKLIINPKFDLFGLNYEYTKDSKKISRLQKFFMVTVKFPAIRFLLPILIKLPLDKVYDDFSAFIWKYLYYKPIYK